MSSSEESPDECQDYEINFSPKYFLRCHSKQRKDAADVQTQIWQCAFEPLPTDTSKTTDVVATCGGNSICFISVKTGQVKKKYYASNSRYRYSPGRTSETRKIGQIIPRVKHYPESSQAIIIIYACRENFLALSWTTIEGNNILAAGGSIQTIYFISYEDGFCFREEKLDKSIIGAKSGITSIMFHPVQKNILYFSCSNGKIVIMNIGTPVKPEFNMEFQTLYKYQVECEVFMMVYYLKLQMILATSDDGIYCWQGDPELCAEGEVRQSKILLQFPGRPIALTESPSLVDTVEVLENGLIASKCALRGAIYIWNADEVLKDLPENDITLRIIPLYQLEWSNTDNYFMYLGYDSGCKYLACGDDKGAIWMYALDKVVKTKIDTQDDPTHMIRPTTVLEWPNLHDQYSSRKSKLNLDVYDIVINKTILSHGSKYLVAVTNNNMVCIWKKKKDKKDKLPRGII